MTKIEVLSYLEENQDARGIAHWESHAGKAGGLRTYGVGLTRLRKFAKGLSKDASLARELWQSDVYEMKIISLLVDDPKTMTLDQVEKQVDQLEGGYLAHVFSSCGATLARTSFVVELAEQWMTSDDPVRRPCGYGLLYEISKDKRRSAPDDAYFRDHLDRIDASWKDQPILVLMAMGGAVQGIGVRNKELHSPALALAHTIGPIDFDPNGRCDPFNVAKNLTSDYVRKKFGL
jgi:3-methyladenine DNA glycosylase AlkD